MIAAFAANLTLGGVAEAVRFYSEACARHGTKPGRITSSYFIHFADTPEQERAARERQLRYGRECGGAVSPGDRNTAPASYDYYHDFKDRMRAVRPEDIDDRWILLGTAPRIIDTLKRMEALGFDEVILYFNVGLKPHQQVKDEMARFMAEVAPAFRGGAWAAAEGGVGAAPQRSAFSSRARAGRGCASPGGIGRRSTSARASP